MVLVLTIFSLVAAGALGAVYSVTEEPIALVQKVKQEQAIKDVLPAFTELDTPVVVNGFNLYKAYNDGEFVGAAVESFSMGFSGEVKVMVGFDVDGNIVDYSVLEQKETPGLGTKMVDWFKSDKADIRGLNPAETNLTVSKDGGDIDAITAATISSRSFLLAVSNAYNAYNNQAQTSADAVSGATAQTADMPQNNVEPNDTTLELGVSSQQ
jgi:electron transport complex protein RnfG